MFDLGVKRNELEDVLKRYANPNLVRFAEILLEKVDAGDFVAGVVGQNVVLEGMAFSVFEMMHAGNQGANPKFAQTLAGTIADERRHVGFGENRIGSLVREHPEKKPEIERMQEEMSYYMLATFADQFRGGQAEADFEHMHEAVEGERAPAQWQGIDVASAPPEQLEEVLSDTILEAFKERLARIGIEYQTPKRP